MTDTILTHNTTRSSQAEIVSADGELLRWQRGVLLGSGAFGSVFMGAYSPARQTCRLFITIRAPPTTRSKRVPLDTHTHKRRLLVVLTYRVICFAHQTAIVTGSKDATPRMIAVKEFEYVMRVCFCKRFCHAIQRAAQST
jgi:hypothetical protein